MSGAERARRYRARLKGEDVPKLPPGPKKGYKQSNEHVQKRKRFGPKHHAWKDDNLTINSGRTRALRKYPIKPCEICGSNKSERHHKNGDTKDNTPENIQFLCRRCHMVEDGRLDGFKLVAKQNQPRACAARWNKDVLQS